MRIDFKFWADAKHAAREASCEHGYAWITGTDGDFQISSSSSAADAPGNVIAEFINGDDV